MDRPESYELSKLEIQDLTSWPDTMVEDYRNLSESINQLFDAITTIAANTPAPDTATSDGIAGQIAYDSGFIYVCVAENTWMRAALSTW